MERISFGYEDTDKKIEIELYGLVFEVKNIENIEELENLDKNNNDVVEAQINKILGSGAVEKINNKRISDGYDKMTLDIKLNVLGCIMSAYAEQMVKNPIEDVENNVDKLNQYISNIADKRNYNKRNNYRRRYRRY